MYTELAHTQIALFLLQVVSQGMGIAVGQARSKYGIKYPLLYAVPGTKGDIQPVRVSSGGSCLCQEVHDAEHHEEPVVATDISPSF
jgi:hypothetical protein